ncbi:MAG: DUF4261 domain-containing protein [Litoreibacter sp.]
MDRPLIFWPSNLKASEIAARVLYIAKHLICDGPNISNGDTMGFDEREKLRVRLVDQGYRPGIPVLALEVEETEKVT